MRTGLVLARRAHAERFLWLAAESSHLRAIAYVIAGQHGDEIAPEPLVGHCDRCVRTHTAHIVVDLISRPLTGTVFFRYTANFRRRLHSFDAGTSAPPSQ
jgi:hypothetical protein